jgi:hypothetical protein
VIYMSGYTEDTILQQGIVPGIAFLQKPFTSDALARAIRAAIDIPETTPARPAA